MYNLSGLVQRQTDSSNLGGPFQGFSATPTIHSYRDSQQVMTRRIVSRSWNTSAARGSINGKARIVTPFRAVTNNGDFLGRQYYVCGGSVENNSMWTPGNSRRSLGAILSRCDDSGVPAGSSNHRYVPDSSDYVTYRRQRALNQVYNDLSSVGDAHRGSYEAMKRVRK
jgi:hypothetical protein